MKHIIYGLIHPISQELRYIGFTSNEKERYIQHLAPSALKKNTYKNKWIKSLLSKNLKPVMIVLEEYSSAKELPQAEVELIEYYSAIGCNLTNGDPGGIGGKGRKHTTEQNKKKSEMQKGRKILWGTKISESKIGHIVSTDTRKKISEANLGKISWNKGKNSSSETKQKLSSSHLITNRLITKCLFCKGNTNFIINLGETPLANNFTNQPENQDIFPLKLIQCKDCNHVQLNYIVNRKTLFTNYLYVSGTSKVNVQHFKDYAYKVIDKFSLTDEDTVCDIASNDGCFLQNFKDKNIKVIGIDPAQNIAEQANNNGIFTIADFFGSKLAYEIKKTHGKMKVITCNNMLAHNMGIKEIIKGAKILLDKDGSFIFENSYLLDIVDHNLMDLVYHEHIHHFHITPLVKLFDNLGMDIYEVERLPNHGGSIRVYTCLKKSKKIHESVFQCIELEKTINEKLIKLQSNISELKLELNKLLYNINIDNKTIAIYGFPAKATTLMYGLNIDHSLINFIVDDAKLKQGKFIPSTDIQRSIKVEHPDVISERNPDYILILAWNFAPSIIEKCKANGYKGKFIIPLPELRVV